MSRCGWSPTRSASAWVAAVLIVAAVVLVYRGTLSYPYVLDDNGSISANPSIRRLWPLSVPLSVDGGRGETVAGRPVLNLSFALNYAAGGTDVRGYRAANIAIHACAALLLFGLVRRTLLHGEQGPAGATTVTGGATAFAFASALVWAVHPLQTESVTYVVQRAESLMGLFFLLALYSFARAAGEREAAGRRRRTAWLLLSVAACAVGMGTKEVMVSAPLIVLLYDRTFLSGTFSGALRARPRTYAALASTWIILASLVVRAGSRAQTIGPSSGIGPFGYALCQARALFQYIRLSYFPAGQVFDYGSDRVDHPLSVLPHILALLALLGAAVWALRGPARSARAVAGFLGASFFIILAPSSSFVGGIRQMLAEHRMYLPLAALVLLTAAGLRARLGNARAVLLLLAAAVALGAAAARRNAVYATPLSLYGQTVARRPANPWVRCNYGNALEGVRQYTAAVRQFNEAITLMPGLHEAHYNLGFVLDAMGRRKEALAEYTAAIDLPGAQADQVAKALVNRGVDHGQLGDLGQAIADYTAAIGLPGARAEQVAKALFNRGVARGQLGDQGREIADYTAVIGLPGAPAEQVAMALFNRGITDGQRGNRDREIAEFGESIRLNPAETKVYLSRGEVYEATGRYARAAADYEAAARGGSGSDAYNAWAWLQAACPDERVRDGGSAVAHATKACELSGWNDSGCLDTLAAAYAEEGRFDEAVEWESRALALPHSKEDADDARRRLGLYREKKPFRETGPLGNANQ